MATTNVKFWKGTSEDFKKLTRTAGSGFLYFVTDTLEVYLESATIPIASNATGEVANPDTGSSVAAHINNTDIHITAGERSKWNGYDAKITANTTANSTTSSNLSTHTSNGTIHVTGSNKTQWNGYDAKITANTTAISSEATTRANEDSKLNKKIDDLVLGGGAMVYQNTFTDLATFVALVKASNGIKKGFSYTYAGSKTSTGLGITGMNLEAGDMIIFVGTDKLPPETGTFTPTFVLADFTIIQANLTGAVTSSDALTDGNLVIGKGTQNIGVSSITSATLSTAITNATNAVSKTVESDQTIKGKLIATGGFSGDLAGNATTANQLSASKNFSISGGATADAVGFNGSSGVDLVVSSLDASKLSSGTVPVARLSSATTAANGVVKYADTYPTSTSTSTNTVPSLHLFKTKIDDLNTSISNINSSITNINSSITWYDVNNTIK